MKRIFSLFLIFTLLLSCVGCGANPGPDQPDSSSDTTAQNNSQETPEGTPPIEETKLPQESVTETLAAPPAVNDIPDEPEEISEEPYVRTIDPSRPMVALTFDDGPHKTNSHALLDILEGNHGVATFFEVARNISQAPDALVRMLELGCEIGSHSKGHQDLSLMNQAGILANLDAADQSFINATGQAPTLVRPPYGATNKAVRLGSGRSIIMWTVDTLDWKLKDAQKVTDYIQNYGDLDGQIVLLHSIHDSTVESMRTVIPWLIEQGYQLVTVTELLAYYYGEYPELNKYYGYDYLMAKRKTDTPLEIPEGGYIPTPVEIPVIQVSIPSSSQATTPIPSDTPVTDIPPADVPQETPGTDTPPADVPQDTPGTDTPPADVPQDTPGTDTPPADVPQDTPGTDTPPITEVPSDPTPNPGEINDPNQPPAWLNP